MTQDSKLALEDFRKEFDIAGINKLWETHSTGASPETKSLFIDAYQYIYEMISYDLACMRFEDERGITEDLLDLLRSIENIDPQSEILWALGTTYEQLADFTEDDAEKLKFLDQALIEHKKYQQLSGKKTEHRVADVLFEQMKIRKQYPTTEIEQILQLLNSAFAEFRNEVLWEFSNICFGLLELPDKIAKPYFNQFFDCINTSMAQFAQKDVLVYYEWEKILGSNQSKPFIEKEESTKIEDKKLFVLDQLKLYKTKDHEILNNLGSTFARNARFYKGPLQMDYYEVAVDYFLQAKKIQYLAWTYPVYATNALKEMAHIHFEQGQQQQALDTFQRANAIFDESNLPDFTFNSYWAEFLLDFAKTIYSFKNDELMNKAKTKFQVAKSLGNNSYSSPFFGIAKILLKQGYTEDCLKELQECDQVFKPLGTQLTSVLEDEDFESIWPQIEQIIHRSVK